MTKNNITSLEFACRMCDTIISTYDAKDLPGPPGRFNYIQGVFLLGLERAYMLCKNQRYVAYIKEWMDSMILPDGTIICQKDLLDDLMPAVLLIRLYKETGEEKYKIALDSTVSKVKTWKRNAYGGFYHKFETENQMWLDGLFMAGILLTSYAKEYNVYELFDEMYHQTKLMHDHIRDEKTGLYYHAWDASKVQKWADPQTGRSPEFWGRAMGWFSAALCDMLDNFPMDHPKRNELINILADLLKALAKYQDAEKGLWYQVIDKGDREDNWCETSCSSLFTYSFHKAIRMGYINKSYAQVAQKGYEGIINIIRLNEDGSIVIPDISVGTNVMDYKGYVARPKVENDNHGTGAFVLMCCECALPLC